MVAVKLPHKALLLNHYVPIINLGDILGVVE